MESRDKRIPETLVSKLDLNTYLSSKQESPCLNMVEGKTQHLRLSSDQLPCVPWYEYPQARANTCTYTHKKLKNYRGTRRRNCGQDVIKKKLQRVWAVGY